MGHDPFGYAQDKLDRAHTAGGHVRAPEYRLAKLRLYGFFVAAGFFTPCAILNSLDAGSQTVNCPLLYSPRRGRLVKVIGAVE
jgi:hypothetical protein